ncbi:MAG: SDR family NAD(P)-dependent oxidoreductase [Bacteroidetes bacterium]|nr:SDR family NAD(P)-dependent oxidoreductase [Bacteroidota bacterium]
MITGATSGIGKATAELFARNGYRLIITGRRVERLIALKNSLESEFGSDVLLLPFDVRDAGAVEAALTSLPEAFQQIDILVNNAGLAKGFSPIHEGSLSHWDTMIDTNVKGLVYVSRIVAQGMVQRRSGHIINVGSIAGKEIYPNGNVYCASKAAVDALTRAMRYDLFTYNIRVSQVSPGHVEETEFAINRFDGDAERAKIYNDFQPLTARDVADAIYYMATRPAHVNIQDMYMFATQQASATAVNRSGRE